MKAETIIDRGTRSQEIDRATLRFTRGGSTMVRGQEETGPGLAISKALIEQQGGILSLESQPGMGSS